MTMSRFEVCCLVLVLVLMEETGLSEHNNNEQDDGCGGCRGSQNDYSVQVRRTRKYCKYCTVQ
jgi:hypothetical protein